MVLVFRSIAPAQTVSGTVKGVVMDSTCAIVPGATCSLVNESTNTSAKVQPFADGSFTFNSVQPGTYTIKIDAAGFKSLAATGVVVTAGELRDVGEFGFFKLAIRAKQCR